MSVRVEWQVFNHRPGFEHWTFACYASAQRQHHKVEVKCEFVFVCQVAGPGKREGGVCLRGGAVTMGYLMV